MDRRSTLSAMVGKLSSARTFKAPVLGGSLNPYTGPWTVREAAHLLRRATFGPSQAQIDESVSLGLNGTIEKLFTENIGFPDPPVKWILDEPHPDRRYRRFIPYVDDPEVEYGETWINAKLLPRTGDQQRDIQIINYRQQSMLGWIFKLMNKNSMTIREKMTIFWHNHFVVAEFRIPKLIYQYINTIHQNVVGDFKQLTKDITLDPSMLLYLNGAENTAAAPNENYARELLELFTIGKGDLAGPGDYTNYTEDDVRAISRALTGWTIDPGSLQGSEVDTLFAFFNHDIGRKQLSHRFKNAVITNNGDKEYADVIDIIFQQDEVSRFICRKLYRYFIHYNITPQIETDVIEPMSQILRDNDYVIEPALRALLSSEHFYGEEAIGCMIKNPGDFHISLLKGMNFLFDGRNFLLSIPEGVIDGDLVDYYNSLVAYQMSADAGMAVYEHPDVAGWKAYYQAPTYYRTWINTFTLPIRTKHSAAMIAGGSITVANREYDIDKIIPVLDIVNNIPGAEDPNELIHALARRFFPYGITDGQKDFLKEILIPGLPDFEWTVEYSDYLSDPDDRQKREAVENRLRAMFSSLLEMPEAQLM